MEHLVDDLEQRPATAGEVLLVLDEIERVGRKWTAKAERGEKKRMGDFHELDRWRRRWLKVAEAHDDPAVKAKAAEVRARLED